MRPVNLIPPEERRSGPRASRTGIAAYVMIGGLLAVLGAVTLMVTTQNSISESESEIARLQQEEEAATARAESLRAFADFAAAQQARTATVSTLAQSRFDWERVLRELAIVIPPGVTLETLTGTVSPDSSTSAGSTSGMRTEIVGPALTMTGCAPGQEGVAALVTALEDIDGVTRVGLASSEGGEASDTSTAGECPSGTSFDLVVAFDAVVVEATAPPVAPPTSVPTDDGGVGAAQQEQADAAESVQESAERAESAVTSTAGQ